MHICMYLLFSTINYDVTFDRVYEERELQEQQAREKKKLEMDNQRNRLVEQLEFEKSKDFLPKVEKWSKAVADDEEELQKLQAEEKRQMEV